MNVYQDQGQVLAERDYYQLKLEKRERIRLQQERLKKKRRRRQTRKLIIVLVLFAIALLLLVWTLTLTLSAGTPRVTWEENTGMLPNMADKPDWKVDYLTPNRYSRPGDALEKVKNIFVHYTANPGTSADQNRSYFEQLKDTHERSASAHFIIGYEGEILQCIPLDEIAYAVQTRNYDSISVECCYLNEDGSFTQETYDSLISLLTYLLNCYHLDADDLLRHYDCGGKKCPLYYVDHEDKWEQLKKDVKEKQREYMNLMD